MEAGNYLVNSSQGGGFKDTWIMEAWNGTIAYNKCCK
jgi:uncharacterized circularly permuted ATP-grasp superfamily protein